ncbi:hepatic lectin-like, partial [Sander vitreus]
HRVQCNSSQAGLLLVLLCVLLLAGIIGTGLHCKKGRIKMQTHNKSWAEMRNQTLVEFNHFCKDGCRSFGDSFYYISSDKMSWNGSRQDCRDRGADLVVVNKRRRAFINSFMRIFWIGLTDKEEEGTWKWIDGFILNSTGFWKAGEPSGKYKGMEEDCVETRFH